MSGKGDTPRNCFSERFRDGWERVFGKNKTVTVGKPVRGKKEQKTVTVTRRIDWS